LVIEDDPLMLSGVRSALQADGALQVVAEAGADADALVKARRLQPDVSLITMHLAEETDGPELVRRLTRQGSAVVLVAGPGGDAHVLAAILAGVRGYLLRGCAPDMMRTAVRAAACGHAFLDPAVTARVLDHVTRTAHRARPVPVQRLDDLSTRELEVLLLLAEGMAPRRMASTLSIALPTVRSHISSILRKLGVGTALEAAVLAHQAGLLEE
jgi:DNA-binding NarL/FixJ family response regulator